MSRVILVGCGAQKAKGTTQARNLYTSTLFKKRAHFADRTGCPWWIVSARYGLLNPGDIVSPYDLRLGTICQPEQAAWGLHVCSRLLDELGDDTKLRDVHVELHMGAEYADWLFGLLQASGMAPSWPVKGLSIGQQLQWYVEREMRLIV